jgi:hypothetical protein
MENAEASDRIEAAPHGYFSVLSIVFGRHPHGEKRAAAILTLQSSCFVSGKTAGSSFTVPPARRPGLGLFLRDFFPCFY